LAYRALQVTRELGRSNSATSRSRTTSFSLPQPSADLARKVVGVWHLLSREDYDHGGERNIDPIMGPSPIGLLCFGPTRFAAQFMNPDRSGATVPPPVSGPNNSGTVNGYDAYFGSYTIDATAGTVTVQLEGALSPANTGQAFIRDIRVGDDRLWIQLKTTAADGTPITRTLTFARDG
jgi:hypothetical protein